MTITATRTTSATQTPAQRDACTAMLNAYEKVNALNIPGVLNWWNCGAEDVHNFHLTPIARLVDRRAFDYAAMTPEQRAAWDAYIVSRNRWLDAIGA